MELRPNSLKNSIGTGVKVGLLAGTVYYTVEEGIWKDSSHTEEVYANLYKKIAPYMKDIPMEVPEIPNMGEIMYQARKYWNRGVIVSCMFLSELPHNSVEWTKQGYTFVVKQFDETSAKKQGQ